MLNGRVEGISPKLFNMFRNTNPKNISEGNNGRVIAINGIDAFLNQCFIKKGIKIDI